MFELGGLSIRGFTAHPNTAPSALPDTYSFAPNVRFRVQAAGVLGNDTDAEGDPLSAVLVSPAQHGDVMLLADGSFTYIPAAGFSGSDAFVYQASDGLARSFETIVSLNPLQVPGLAVAPHTNGQYTICWPNPSAGWVLQSTTDLRPPIQWQDVDLPAVIMNNQLCVVIDPRSKPAEFFRLHLPPRLPTFKVAGPGVTPAQFETLAAMLKLPGDAYGQDGSVHFINPQSFEFLPTEVIGQGVSDEDKADVVMEGFLFDEIAKMTVPDDATALSLARTALGQSELTPADPYKMSVHLAHSQFTAVDSNGVMLADQPIDTQVHYGLQLAGLPVVGPGAHINLVFDGDQAATRVTYALRRLSQGATMPILAEGDAQAHGVGRLQGRPGQRGAILPEQPVGVLRATN